MRKLDRRALTNRADTLRSMIADRDRAITNEGNNGGGMREDRTTDPKRADLQRRLDQVNAAIATLRMPTGPCVGKPGNDGPTSANGGG